MKSTTFVCDPSRSRDEDGILISAGVTWREATQLKRGRIFSGCVALGGALMVFSIANMLRGWTAAAGFYDFVAVACVIAAVVLFLMPSPDRSIVFAVEDWIATPLGLKYFPDTVRWRFRPSDILSIEVALPQVPDQDRFRHDVVFLMESGETIHVAGDLHREHATMLARQMTKAWSEVLAAQGMNTFYGRV